MNSNSNVRISVVVPVYNVEAYIVDCLKSIAAQTMTDGVECIFVDDCGGDRSIELVEEFLKAYKGAVEFSIICHEENRGPSAARNTGVAVARGKYVYFLDSDDWITPDCLRLLYDAAESMQADFAIADFTVIGSTHEFKQLAIADGRVLRGGEIMHGYALRRWFQMPVNKLCRQDFLQRADLSFREGVLFEDELWSFEQACTARSLIAVGLRTYIYRKRPGSITTTKIDRQKLSYYPVILEGMAERVRRSALQSNKDACLRYYTSKSAFLLNTVRNDASIVKDCYAKVRRVNPFGAWTVLRAVISYPRPMINSILGIKSVGYGLGVLWLKLRSVF